MQDTPGHRRASLSNPLVRLAIAISIFALVGVAVTWIMYQKEIARKALCKGHLGVQRCQEPFARQTSTPTTITTFAYDAAGNQRSSAAFNGTAVARTTFTWDNENRLKNWFDGSTRVTMTYNADGQRMALDRTPGGDFRWVWDGQNVLQETDDSGATLEVDTLAPQQFGNLVSRRRLSAGNWLPRYCLWDGLGSLDRETGATETQEINKYVYQAFGDIVSEQSVSVATNWRYVGWLGYYYDRTTTALPLYVRARWLATGLGRFLTSDPLDPPVQNSKYLYALNNPTNLIDPTGLVPNRPPGFVCRGTCAPPGSKTSIVSRGLFKSITFSGASTVMPLYPDLDLSSYFKFNWAPDLEQFYRSDTPSICHGTTCSTCCDEVGIIQIAKLNTGFFGIGGGCNWLVGPLYNYNWRVDGQVPYDEKTTNVSYPLSATRDPATRRILGAAIEFDDQPGFVASLPLCQTALLRLDFETCAVCMSGIEGLKVGSVPTPGGGISFFLTQLVTYGCVSWHFEFTFELTAYTWQRGLSGPATLFKAGIGFGYQDTFNWTLPAPSPGAPASQNFFDTVSRYYQQQSVFGVP